jgi:hypothetical protein
LLRWGKQGAARVASLQLCDGRKGKAVVVGPPGNPRSAMIVVARPGGTELEKLPLADCLDQLYPSQVVDVMCQQERAFGARGLPSPDED